MGERGNVAHNQRIIKMVDRAEDPMEPAKFKHRKLPRGPGSPPPPIMHSPPRKVTAKEQAEWVIPPSVSNWKNPKGYTIPLDKRMAARGQHLSDIKINDNFAKLSEALYAADRAAREEVQARSRIQAQLAAKEREDKEQALKALAEKARRERFVSIRLFLTVDSKVLRHVGTHGRDRSLTSLRKNPRKDQMRKLELVSVKNCDENEIARQEGSCG